MARNKGARCFAAGCNKLAEQWHHVIPRCVTGQKKSDLRGTVPLCRRHHAMATNEKNLIKQGAICWEATRNGRRHIKQLMRLYANGQSFAALGRKFGISAQTARNSFLRSGGVPRRCGDHRKLFTTTCLRQLVAQYLSGQSAKALAAKYKCNKSTVLDTLRRAGIAIRDPRRPQLLSASIQTSIIAQRDSGFSCAKLASKHKCSETLIRLTLRRAKVLTRRKAS